MRMVTLRASWSDFSRLSARHERYADSSESRILQIGRLILSHSLGTKPFKRESDDPPTTVVEGNTK